MLVVIVVLIFLQSWRATIIPLCAVPVSLIGTFAVMKVFGFSLNNLSLFGLVLAIGIVVDDAIVVVENVERWLEEGHSPVEATIKAMDEVSGAVVAIAIVLTAVFVPTALISGITGQFYRQFALTIAVATVISAFNSLTLSPALAALLLRPKEAKKDFLTRGSLSSAGLVLPAVQQGLRRGQQGVHLDRAAVDPVRGDRAGGLRGAVVPDGVGFKTIPTGFIPSQDQGYIFCVAQLPDGASLQRTDAVRKQISDIARKVPGVGYTVEITGLSALDFTNRSNTLTMFLPFKPFDERKGHPEQTMDAILGKVQGLVSKIQDAFVLVVPPPPVQGIGNAGGFKLQVEDRRSAGAQALAQAANQLIAAGEKAGRAGGVLHDAAPAGAADLSQHRPRQGGGVGRADCESVFQTLQAELGSYYVNDFNFLGRTYQVNMQGEPSSASAPTRSAISTRAITAAAWCRWAR